MSTNGPESMKNSVDLEETAYFDANQSVLTDGSYYSPQEVDAINPSDNRLSISIINEMMSNIVINEVCDQRLSFNLIDLDKSIIPSPSPTPTPTRPSRPNESIVSDTDSSTDITMIEEIDKKDNNTDNTCSQHLLDEDNCEKHLGQSLVSVNDVFNDNESDYPSKRSNGSDYGKPPRVSPKTNYNPNNSYLYDWKYSTDGYQGSPDNYDKYKNSYTDYNPLNYWTSKLPNNSEEQKFSDNPNITSIKVNDTSDLINDSEKFKAINEDNYVHYDNSPKPDVLAFATEDKKVVQLKDKINDLETKVTEKDSKIEELNQKLNEMNQQLNAMKEKDEKQMNLINTFHGINQEIVINCTQLIDERDKMMEQKQKQLSELSVINENMKNELNLCQESENLFKRQHSLAAIKIKELNDKYNAIAGQQLSMNENKELQNELITVRVQHKKAEMQISSLKSQLDQKSKENNELSSMIDELIAKRQ